MHPDLLQAATAGDVQYIRRLDFEILSSRFSERTVQGNSALHVAAKFGHFDFAKEICSVLSPSVIKSSNSVGDTPIHCAAAAGKDEVVSFFIDQLQLAVPGGYDLSLLKNDAGDTPLHLATRNGHPAVVKLLMSKAPQLAALTNKSGISALYMAAERGSPEMVRSLLKSKEASHAGPRGQTALHAAVLRSSDITMMILLEKPTSAKYEDVNKSTPLHFAVTTGNANMVMRLLVFGYPNVYAQDEDGLSAIHVAAGEGHLDIIKLILLHYPDAWEQRNSEGRNLLHVAVEKKKLQVVKYALGSPLLMELVNESDEEGNTPLHLAVMSRNIEIIRIIASHGTTDTSIMNNQGHTPVDLASSQVKSNMGFRMYNIMADLISRGARPSPQRFDHISNRKETRNQEEEIVRYRTLCNNLAIIAVLVATVTFTAALTLPGGYNSDQASRPGMATLAKRAAFKTFLISDTLAMTISITVTSLLIYSASVDHDVRLYTLQIAMKLMEFAVCGMLVAFAAGVYVAVAHDCLWVSILVCVIVGSVPFCKYIVIYCTYANYFGMRMVIKSLKLVKRMKWLGFIKGKVNPGDVEEDLPPEAGEVGIQSDTTNNNSSFLDKNSEDEVVTDPNSFNYLIRHMPQAMMFISPPSSACRHG